MSHHLIFFLPGLHAPAAPFNVTALALETLLLWTVSAAAIVLMLGRRRA